MTDAASPSFDRALLAPRYWSTWLILGLMWLLARLPYQAAMAAGRGLGAIAARMQPKRRRIAARNLALCLPELSGAERGELLEANLRELGTMSVELSLALMASERAFAKVPVVLEGLEHLERAALDGRGVVLLTAHLSHLELAGRALAHVTRGGCPVPDHENAAFVYALTRLRRRYVDVMFTRTETRKLVKFLRSGGVVVFPADHPSQGRTNLFLPFFGVEAATATSSHHIARLSGAAMIPLFQERRADGSFVFRMEGPLADFPGPDVAADSARLNALFERMIRAVPAQYLWSYKRFKQVPPGAPDPSA
jgi:KDO2-lipid IV(A) lauroyltransferase